MRKKTQMGGGARGPLRPVPTALVELIIIRLAKAGTCARDRRALQQLALNVHVKH